VLTYPHGLASPPAPRRLCNPKPLGRSAVHRGASGRSIVARAPKTAIDRERTRGPEFVAGSARASQTGYAIQYGIDAIRRAAGRDHPCSKYDGRMFTWSEPRRNKKQNKAQKVRDQRTGHAIPRPMQQT